VQWILRHDRQGRFRFAALQSELGRELLARYGLPVDDLDTFVLVQDGAALTRSRAGRGGPRRAGRWLARRAARWTRRGRGAGT
jgi:predicted DCC family thiol-disulfide oxidoreductase YuxK